LGGRAWHQVFINRNIMSRKFFFPSPRTPLSLACCCRPNTFMLLMEHVNSADAVPMRGFFPWPCCLSMWLFQRRRVPCRPILKKMRRPWAEFLPPPFFFLGLTLYLTGRSPGGGASGRRGQPLLTPRVVPLNKFPLFQFRTVPSPLLFHRHVPPFYTDG